MSICPLCHFTHPGHTECPGLFREEKMKKCKDLEWRSGNRAFYWTPEGVKYPLCLQSKEHNRVYQKEDRMKTYIPKITKNKIKYFFYWQCRKCGETHSYSQNKCLCKNKLKEANPS